MDAAEMLALADNWMGEGTELARRVLAYAERLRTGRDYSSPGPEAERTADDLTSIVTREWDPTEEASRW
jgi:hypothetical protein